MTKMDPRFNQLTDQDSSHLADPPQDQRHTGEVPTPMVGRPALRGKPIPPTEAGRDR